MPTNPAINNRENAPPSENLIPSAGEAVGHVNTLESLASAITNLVQEVHQSNTNTANMIKEAKEANSNVTNMIKEVKEANANVNNMIEDQGYRGGRFPHTFLLISRSTIFIPFQIFH